MESKANVLIVYVDALPGEATINDLIKHLYGWNALHVQVMSTVTRQNTEGYTVMVEIENEDEWRLAKGLAQAYGIARYHRLETTLHYQPVAQSKRPIVATYHEKQFGMTIAFALIGTEREPLYVQVKDGDMATLHDRVAQEFGLEIAENTLRERLESLLMHDDGFVLELAE